MESTYTNKPTYKISWICDPMSSDPIMSRGYYQLMRLSDNAILSASTYEIVKGEVIGRGIVDETSWE